MTPLAAHLILLGALFTFGFLFGFGMTTALIFAGKMRF